MATRIEEKKPLPNCAKCKWFLQALAVIGGTPVCLAVGGEIATDVHGDDRCRELYEETQEQGKNER